MKILGNTPDSPKLHLFYNFDASKGGLHNQRAKTYFGSYHTPKDFEEAKLKLEGLLLKAKLPMDARNYIEKLEGKIEVSESELQFNTTAFISDLKEFTL